MNPRELEEYPICNICHRQIDEQEAPYCSDCRSAMEDDDWEVDPENYLWVHEFDSITITRQMIHERIGRIITNDEWEAFTTRLGGDIDDMTWNLIENAIEELKGGKL